MELEDKVSFVVQQTVGRDLLNTIGKVLFRDPITCVLELVANSYDADAEDVNITYKPGNNLLVVEDDGEGMDRDEIHAFFRTGDSTKKYSLLSKKGRRRIGRHGIATLVLRTLSNHYVVEAFKDGLGYRIDDTVTEIDGTGKSLDVSVSDVSKRRHGVVITVDDLRFLKEDRTLDVNEFKSRLAIEMPVSHDFAISFNGETIEPRIKTEGAEYAIDEQDKLAGEITGSIYYSSVPLKTGENGIWIKVNGKAVGGPNLDIFRGGVKKRLASRIFGIVHADDLADIVDLGRGQFVRHGKFENVVEIVSDVIAQIKQDADFDASHRKVNRVSRDLSGMLTSVGIFVGKALDTEPYEVVFNSKKAGKVSNLDRENHVLYVNPNSPAIVLPSTKPIAVKFALLGAARHAIVYSSLEADARECYEDLEIKIGKRLQSSVEVSLSDLIGKNLSDETPELRQHRISPNRCYIPFEASIVTGFSEFSLSALVDSKLLSMRKDRKYLGRALLDVCSTIGEGRPIFDVITSVYPDRDFVFHHGIYVTTVKKLEDLIGKDEDLPSYIRNVATGKNKPFYTVDRGSDGELLNLLTTGNTSSRGSLSGAAYAFCNVGTVGAVVVYVLRVDDSMVFSDVKPAAGYALKFVNGTDGQDALSDGIKQSSFFTGYNGSKYVVGFYAGDHFARKDLRNLETKFSRNGFREVSLDNTVGGAVVRKLLDQRRQTLPIVETRTLDGPYMLALTQMLAA